MHIVQLDCNMQLAGSMRRLGIVICRVEPRCVRISNQQAVLKRGCASSASGVLDTLVMATAPSIRMN